MRTKPMPTEAQIRIIAGRIAARVVALPANCAVDDVFEVVRKYPASGEIIADAFSLLDNKPGRFADHHIWHPRIRALRNHPSLGEQLFNEFARA